MNQRLFDEVLRQYGVPSSSSIAPAKTTKDDLQQHEAKLQHFIDTKLKGSYFWFFDQDLHRKIIASNGGRCTCAVHRLGLPRKNGKPMPIWYYQRPWFEALCNDTDPETNYFLPTCNPNKAGKRLLLHKPIGIGATTWALYWATWLACKSNDLQGSECAIVVGPNWDLAQGLLDKLRRIFLRQGIELPGSKTATEINGCLFKTYPSGHLPAIRSREPKIVICDEFDWFATGSRSEVRESIDRYSGKGGGAWILAMSTPNNIGGLMYELEREEPSLYQKIIIDYRVGVGTIYSREEIDALRKSPAWGREMAALFGSTTGNVFVEEDVLRCIEAGKTVDLNNKPQPGTQVVIGLDPGFSAPTGITVIAMQNGRLEVLYADEWDVEINVLFERVMQLYYQYGGGGNNNNCRILVDSASPVVWQPLARMVGDRDNYWERVKDMERDEIPKHRIMDRFRVHPVVFGNNGHREMLQHFRAIADDPSGLLAIPERFDKLLASMRSAIASEDSLDKRATNFPHVFDSTRIALSFFNYNYDVKERAEEAEVSRPIFRYD